MQTAKLIKQALLTLLLSLSFIQPSESASENKHVAITQFIEHAAVDAVREGLIKELANKGFIEGQNLTLTFENAQGNAATATQIARKLVGLRPDVIVAITTPSAQSVVKAVTISTIPVVFSAVTDPIGAGIVPSLTHQEKNVTGVMDAPPIEAQIKMIKTILPKVKTVGVLYNPGDEGATSSLPLIQEALKAEGLAMVEASPVKSSDIQSALLSLVGRVDAIYVPLDNMLVSAMPTLSALALKHRLPVFSADSGSVEAGALACYGYSYPQTGQKTGDIVVEILKGKPAHEIPIASPETLDIFINRKMLEALDIDLPEDIRAKAHFY